MASTRLMISPQVQGDEYGDCFDDGLIIKDDTHVALTRIIVEHGEHIHSLTMHYTGSHAPVARGGLGKTRTEIILGPGEFITTMDSKYGPSTFHQLIFMTNKGVTFGPYGWGTVGPRVLLNASDGAPADLAHRMGLLYFSGSACANYLRQLRATFALYPGTVPEVAKLSSNVKFEQRDITQQITAAGKLSSFAREIMSPGVVVRVGPEAATFYIPEATIARIPFFRGILLHGPHGAPGKNLTLREDRPEIFTALLEHLSTGSYTYTYDSSTATVTDGLPAPDLTQGYFHVSVFQMARTYDWQPLVDDAVNNFRYVLANLAGIDVVRLWKQAYGYGLTVPVCLSGGGLAHFETSLPGLLKEVYKTHSEEMTSTVMGCPALADDFMRLQNRG